jgi:hypothetical protein
MTVCVPSTYTQALTSAWNYRLLVMTHLSSSGDIPETLNLVDLTPYLSITILRCVGDDPTVADTGLMRFLHRSAYGAGRAVEARVRSEVTLSAEDAIGGLGTLGQLGFDSLYGVTREVWRVPGWTDLGSGLIDVEHQLMIAVRRNNLVAICTPMPSEAQIRKWIDRELAPYRLLPPDVLADSFHGDGKMVWMRGVHRRRSSKADNKALGGIRVQDVVDPIEDGSYTLKAVKVDFQPEDDALVLRDLLTVSPGKSRISWKRTSYFPMFLAATAEALDLLEKALVAPDEPAPLFSELAVSESDLDRVRGAFDIMATDPDIVRADPGADDDQVENAELLFDSLLEVRGDPDSAVVKVDVGYDGAVAGTLSIRPVEAGGGFDLDVRITGTVYHESNLRRIKDAIDDGDLLTVYYQSGHTFVGRQLVRQRLANRPFSNVDFSDFSGFEITREKPRAQPGQSLHDAIAVNGDDSLFAWVVRQFSKGWLLCDDGAGEVADFLHLADDGTLTVIHVKAADSRSARRRIAVTRFEQVVSQAGKNILFLDNEMLVERLSRPRAAGSAAWCDGRRVPGMGFVDQLRARVTSDRTIVVIVQPHLLRSVHDLARAASDAGKPNGDSYSLMLLDNLLHSTRRTIAARCDELRIIGCADGVASGNDGGGSSDDER